LVVRSKTTSPMCQSWQQKDLSHYLQGKTSENDQITSMTEAYTIEDYLKFFQTVLNRNSPHDRLELWKNQGRYDLFFLSNDTLIARVFLHKKEMYLVRKNKSCQKTSGHGQLSCQTFPIIVDDNRMNLDFLCIFLLQKIAARNQLLS
jgi:hypothetical protein